MNSARGGSNGQGSSRPTADDAAQVVPSAEDAVVRRTKDGWRVGGAELPDLTSAMVLADLLAAELAAPAGGSPEQGAAGPAASGGEAADTSKLRATIGQLEHALMARVRVEQAIGVLAERHRIQPRQAFEQLRNAARSRGKRVIDIASDVVASATNPLLQLPDELSRPRSPGRQTRQPRGILGSE
jgi:ANTAR domain